VPRIAFAIANAFVACIAFAFRAGRGRAPPANPSRILLANAGHIGDLLLMRFTIPVIRERFPDAKVDLLAGSWAQSLFTGSTLVNRVIELDHWYQDRSARPVAVKVCRYLRAAWQTAGRLKHEAYDIAIDVRMWFPNYGFVLWMAGIPIRIGFRGLNFGAFLTSSAPAEFSRRHEVDVQSDLLRRAFGDFTSTSVGPRGLQANARGEEEVRALLGDNRTGVRVLHVATSTPVRLWVPERWRALTRDLLARGITPVFTGRGDAEAKLIREVTGGLTGCVSACDRLSWDGLVALISRVELVYSTETSVGHLAAALGTPVVAIYGGTADPQRWRPYGARVRVVTNPVRCFPCLRKKGCGSMACIKDIPVAAVQREADILVEQDNKPVSRSDRRWMSV